MYDPGQEIQLRGGVRTNKGQVRENNEDSVHLWAHQQAKMLLAVVADGMGGAAAGEEASRIAIEAVQSALSDGPHKDPEDYGEVGEDDLVNKLRNVVHEANLKIVQRASLNPEFKGMGTTLTLVFARKNQAVIAHVGDSRAYLVDGFDGGIEQITSDHSFVQALVDAGHITADEADEHPMRNVLYRALGQSNDIDVDVHYNTLHIGDSLILCSDGLTLHVKPDEIAKTVMEESDPDAASEKLVQMANKRGGKDNISVIVIRVDSNEEDEPEQKDEPETGIDEYEEDETIVTRKDIVGDDDDTVIVVRKDKKISKDDDKSTDLNDDDDTLVLSRSKRSTFFFGDIDFHESHSDTDENTTSDHSDDAAEGNDPPSFDQ